MEEARQAVEAFMSRNGKHDTTVHERVAPAVTHETITRTEHENVTTALDKEIHQDHYHISIQPITEEEYHSEQHHHILRDVEVQNFEHDDSQEVERRLAEEAGKHTNQVFNVVAEKTTANLPPIEGLHIHHHVHELIQPIVQKQTFEPHVYHIITPIHQIHHNVATHHATSSLPAVTMAEFKKSGGQLGGRGERYDAFEGEPRSVSKALGGKTSSAPSTSSAAQSQAPAPASAASAPAPPAKASALGRGVASVDAAPGPVQPTTEPTVGQSLTATGVAFRREPTMIPSLAREATFAPQGLSRAPTAPTDNTSTSEPFVPRPLARAPTAPAALTREPVAPAETLAPTQDPPAPLAINRQATTPAPTPATPAATFTPVPLTVAPTTPALHRDPTVMHRAPTGTIPPNHPLMNPPTMLPQHVYRGHTGSSVPPRRRHRPEQPERTQSTPGPQRTGAGSTDKPLPDEPRL